MMLLRCPANNPHRPIPRGIIIHLSFITLLQLFNLVLTWFERVIGASGGGIRRGHLHAGEEGQQISERRGRWARGPVKDMRWWRLGIAVT